MHKQVCMSNYYFICEAQSEISRTDLFMFETSAQTIFMNMQERIKWNESSWVKAGVQVVL